MQPFPAVLAGLAVVTLSLLASAAHGEANVFRTVVAPATREHPRNGEGDIVLLKDGRLMLVYSRFSAGAKGDDSPAEICRRYSSDLGKTWTPDEVLIPNDVMNLMSVSLLRLQNGEILLAYGRRVSNGDLRFYARFSKDEGQSWTEDFVITPDQRYYVINNARIVQLKSGRLIAPAVVCRGETWKKDYFFFTHTWTSDDNGRTWKTSGQKLVVPGCSEGAEEPGVVELKDGRVLMVIRTNIGHIWSSISTDGGSTWAEPTQTNLDSPNSPATIARIPTTGDLLLVWNNTPPSKKNKGVPRSPLTTAISKDEGKTWQHVRNLEDAPDGNYCYTSVTFVKDKAVLSFYERAGLKVAMIDDDWFYALK
jgi:Neuraminidase (sialidase)